MLNDKIKEKTQSNLQNLNFREVKSNDIEPSDFFEFAPFTQARFYANWQEYALGKKTRRFVIIKDNKPVLYALLIPCALGTKNFYYTCPYGPIIKKSLSKEDFNNSVALLKRELKKLMRKSGATFTRLDFSPSLRKNENPNESFLYADFANEKILSKYFKKAPWQSVHGACFQPRREWFLPLDKSEDEILSKMHQKTRYNIRLAKRKGIEVEIVTNNLEKYIDEFYGVQKSTAKRNGFSLHKKTYYKEALQTSDKLQNGYLVVARLKEKILTINFVVCYGKIAMFAYGGSYPEHRNLMPSYRAHWEGIKEAKRRGMQFYNFGGYFDENGPKLKPQTLQKRSRFSVFKRKFGGFALEHSPFYDCVNKKFVYLLFLIYKFIRHV